eukprot:5430023-Pyramimonas_sp.AAC.2
MAQAKELPPLTWHGSWTRGTGKHHAVDLRPTSGWRAGAVDGGTAAGRGAADMGVARNPPWGGQLPRVRLRPGVPLPRLGVGRQAGQEALLGCAPGRSARTLSPL